MRYVSFITAISLALIGAPAFAQESDGAGTVPDGSHSEAGVSASEEPSAGHAMHGERADGPPDLLPHVGNGGFPIATEVPEAQAFFDNGMALYMAFSHDEATAAMAEAVRLDPACAMCRWGHALSLGPTLNYGRDADARVAAYAEVVEGQKLAKSGGDAFEAAMLDTLAMRFKPKGDVEQRDKAYAQAMTALAARWPDRDTLQVLAADALMVATDWDDPDMSQPIALIEPVLARNPDDTGAIHFYIHATEIAGTPELAAPYADRLDAMRLNASHLVHMPSHTWYWIGRYQDAADANRRAVMIGEHQAMTLPPDTEGGVWTIPYHAHNVIFGLGGAMMAGDSRTALMLGRPLVEYSQGQEKGSPVRQLLSAAGYFALGRFEDPKVVLSLPEPKLPYLAAARHYARGEAYAFLNDLAGMRTEIAAIPPIVKERESDEELSAPEQMLTITRAVLMGRLAMLEGRYRDAAAAFAEAAIVEETEDFSQFSDPPAFWYPVRRDLALALQAAGDSDGAIREARKTLEIRPLDPVATELLADLGG
ncbi:hypothetical protein [Croceicoccus naphthovorans]|uniref:hypothetical protein n=1 Tax=Croceicoccus naphthovorans TaxID=1348774 RepID=UPI00069FCA44|nr:hypothetical protein [Croceicoccus naphthovorans]MBB3990195.1 hypothetical protein [Croceicoccus naphthovorans]